MTAVNDTTALANRLIAAASYTNDPSADVNYILTRKERDLIVASLNTHAVRASTVPRDLPALPDDDKDFTPDLGRKIIVKYQEIVTHLLKTLGQIAAEADGGRLSANDDELRDWLWAIRDTARAALTSTPSSPVNQPIWQPIETAPKDGTRVLLWSEMWEDSFGIVIARFQNSLDAWVSCEFITADWPEEDCPTHWAPLPDTSTLSSG